MEMQVELNSRTIDLEEEFKKNKMGTNNFVNSDVNDEKGELLEISKNQISDPSDPPNYSSYHSYFCCLRRRIQWKNLRGRIIYSLYPDPVFCNNHICTNKYTLYNFLPKNLFEQFSKVANIYFLVIGIMQMVPAISVSGGTPTIFLPLFTILAISAFKDFLEDYKRYKSDNMENNKGVLVYNNGNYETQTWKDIVPGDIIKIHQDEYFPCDVLLLSSSEPKLDCFIETKNLDGETNLKHKQANQQFKSIISTENALPISVCKLEYEPPNPYLYTFTGTAKLNKETSVSIDNSSFILRGCSLRNTKYVVGLVCYTGFS